MNEQNEIRGDEWADVMESTPCYFCEADEHAADECPHGDEREECNAGAPVVELDEADLEAWYADWLKRNPEADPRERPH